MRENYHNKVLETFCENIELFSDILGFHPKEIRKNICLGSIGEIDISLYGRAQDGLVEVKSHPGLIRKFTEKQFNIYREYNPNAHIFLLLGNINKSLNPLDFHLKKYWPFY